jgi:segregation and condensation protein B
MNTAQAKRVLETALLCSTQPVTVRDMRVLFDDALGADTLKVLLEELQLDWAERGLELISVATGWRFQSRPELRVYLDKLNPEKPPKYTRAVMETLAIIAYRQPVTRGDMEDIRGVTINTQILKQLEDRGWVEVIGHRESVGRPGLYATTRHFLDDLGLSSSGPIAIAGNAEGQAAILASLNADLRRQHSGVIVFGAEAVMTENHTKPPIRRKARPMNESSETPSQDPLRPIAIEDVVSGEFDQEAEGVHFP